MKKVKIISYASNICWWYGCINQTYDVLEIDDSHGYIKIRITYVEKGFEDEPFEIEGWINPVHVEEVKENT